MLFAELTGNNMRSRSGQPHEAVIHRMHRKDESSCQLTR